MTPDMIHTVRGFMDAGAPTDEALARGGAYRIEERRVPGPAGAPDLTLLICTPRNLKAPAPAIYHTHGGGMISGNRRSSTDSMLDLAEPHGMIVVSVEYRLAPEHPDPAPIEDVYAGLVWTAGHADELGMDPERIVIAGASAGGGLTAGLGLLSRDRGGPAVFGQLLACPMIDDRNDTVSSLQMKGLGVWDHVANQTGWDSLLGSRRGGPDVSPYAAAARATELSGLPPTFVDVGSAETFRDEAVAYASRIWAAGGRAELHVWPGGFHGFDNLAPDAAVSRAVRKARQDWIGRLLTR
ncbi:alpha/beta hydrolase [Pseudonocardia halophobica]|uniref:alpha/beta hydrolase n=1 Tax=Pseudonocardia halophobica TaxID=29401 RepID=UPI003D8E349B